MIYCDQDFKITKSGFEIITVSLYNLSKKRLLLFRRECAENFSKKIQRYE